MKKRSSSIATTLQSEVDAINRSWYRDLRVAEKRAADTLAKAIRHRLPNVAADARLTLGLCMGKQGRFAQAEAVVTKSIQSSRKHGAGVLLSRGWNLLGLIYVWRGDFVRAVNSFSESIATAPHSYSEMALAQALTNAGLIYERRNEWRDAHELYQFAYKLKSDLGLVRPRVLINLAAAKYALGAKRQSLRLFKHALKSCENTSQDVFYVQALSNLGFVRAKLGELAEGLSDIASALRRARKLGSVEQELNAIALLAQLQFDTGDFVSAKRNAKALLTLASTFRERRFLVDAHTFLAHIAETRNEWKAAATHLKALLSLQSVAAVDAKDSAVADALSQFRHNAGVPADPKTKASLPSPRAPVKTSSQRARVKLSERQTQVIDLICRGYTNAEIASELGISVATSVFHVKETLAKLGAATRAQAAAIAIAQQRVVL